MAKGGDDERTKCREWSLWWSKTSNIDPPRDDIFYRTSGSGARARARAKLGKRTHGSYGDMQAVDPIGEPLTRCCTFEFKKGYNRDLRLLLCIDSRGRSPLFKTFLEQTVSAAKEAGNEPVMIIHRDFMLPCIVFRWSMFVHMESFSGDFGWGRPRITFHFPEWRDDEFVVLRLKDFFDWMDANYFVARAENLPRMERRHEVKGVR